MSPRATRIRKEARALFRPWCAVTILCSLPLFHFGDGFLHRYYISLSDISAISAYLGIPMLAILSLGNEFQHRTFSLLLSQPVGRMEIWGEKMAVVIVAVLSATVVLCIVWRSTLQQDPNLWVFASAYFLATVPSATFWTLLARSTIGGYFLNIVLTWPFTIIALNWKEILGPNPSATRSLTGLRAMAFAALCYAGAMLWLGRRKLARFQVAGGMAGDDLLMAGPSVIPEALAGLFRCRPTGGVLNLIRKEFRLLRPLWLITALGVVYLTGLTVFRFILLRQSEAPGPEAVWLVLFMPLIALPVVAILAGSLSLWEETRLGTHPWHMTLPVSARRQWLVKLAMAMFTGLVCAVLLPVTVMVVLGRFFGSPLMFVDQAMGGLTILEGSIFGWLLVFVDHFMHGAIPGLLLTGALLTFASFWCACVVRGTVRAALWFAPAMGAVILAVRSGHWISPRVAGLAASRFDPFTGFRFSKAVSSLQSLVLGGTPLEVVTLVMVPTLLLAAMQSYRLFRAPLQDSILSLIRNLLPLAITAFLSVLCLAAFTWDNTNGTIVSSGETRRYLLYVPKSYDRSRPTPLVISMHGAALWPAAEMAISRWNDVADEHGFIVVYPSGTGDPRVWPMGRLSLESDVRFISDLIDKLEAAYNIDPARIYADGMSNGGGMAFALSCRLADRIAAVGAVAAAQMLEWERCGDSEAVPTVAFHGTADPMALYKGGSLPGPYAIHLPNIRDWTARVARRNQCAEDPLEDRIAASVRRLAYTNCAENADVILYTVEGGGHTWPGGKPLPEWWVGPTTREINATRVMWEFFLQHPHGPN